MIAQRPGPVELFKQIRDPVMMLSLFNESIRSGRIVLHPWQVQLMMDFAAVRKVDEIIRIALVANNGSGKSAYSIAPCATWLAGHTDRARSVITSASGIQLDRQSLRSVRHVCENVNKFYDNSEVFRIREREYTFTPAGGTIEAFATDEPGKAEGYHPHDGGEGEFAIFVDEAKSVEGPIFAALERCNGITRRLDVSSPGSPQGYFFDSFTSPNWKTRRVTYRDCPHIKQSEVEEAKMRYGEYSPLFRSMYLAEFTSIEEMTVLQFDYVRRLWSNFYQNEQEMFGAPFAGVDLAAGGDENVLSVWHGNTHVAQEVFREKYTPDTVRHLNGLFKKYGLEAQNITLDDGGLGTVLNDYLMEYGWNDIRRVRNEGRAIDQSAYANRGAENWFNFARIAPKLLFSIKDDVLKNQLASRYYTMNNGKYKLEDKRKAKSSGHKSPDRADACVLAFANRWDNYIFSEDREAEAARIKKFVPERLTQSELVELMEQRRNEKMFGGGPQSEARMLGGANFRAVLARRYGSEVSQLLKEMT